VSAQVTADELRPWGRDVVVDGPLGDGVRCEVVRARLDGVLVVARRSRRPADSLDWELDLLEHLVSHGFVAPMPLPTLVGARRVGALTVSRWVDGHEPSSDRDWGLVVAELRRLHDATIGWPQRPGSLSAHDLLVADAGGDVDLGLMPAPAVTACRAAWAALPSTAPHVIHGDPGAPNLRLIGDRVAMLDWDEARVDHAWFDLADVPTRPLNPPADGVASRAAHAWEAANGWRLEPEYARRRLANLLDAQR